MDVGVREPPTTGQSAYPSSVPCKPISHPRSNKYSFHNRSAELNSIILLHPPGQPFKMHTNTWHQNLLKSRVFLKCTTGLCLWNRKCPTPGCDGSGHVTGRFTAHHCISGCPLAERNQGRLKAELSDSECKRTLFFGQRTKKTHFRGRCVCVCVGLHMHVSLPLSHIDLFILFSGLAVLPNSERASRETTRVSFLNAWYISVFKSILLCSFRCVFLSNLL